MVVNVSSISTELPAACSVRSPVFTGDRTSGRRAMIIWQVAMSRAGAVRWAAGGRPAYAERVAYERITIDPNRMSGLPASGTPG